MDVVVLDEAIVCNVDDDEGIADNGSEVGEIDEMLGKRVSDEMPAAAMLILGRSVSSVPIFISSFNFEALASDGWIFL